MKFIHPEAILITEKDPYKKIELAGRTCYKSEDKITEDSAKRFTRGLIKSQHTAMVEYQVFTFKVEGSSFNELIAAMLVRANPYLRVTVNDKKSRLLVSGNVRAINELAGPNTIGKNNGINIILLRALWEQFPDLAYEFPKEDDEAFCDYMRSNADYKVKLVDIDSFDDLSDEEIGAHKSLTFRFITDRGVTHELVRHRPASYAQESTRYVNYREGISIATPAGYDEKDDGKKAAYETAFKAAEEAYTKLIQLGETPQQARAVLPTALKTEIVMTAPLSEWKWVFTFGSSARPALRTPTSRRLWTLRTTRPCRMRWQSGTSASDSQF